MHEHSGARSQSPSISLAIVHSPHWFVEAAAEHKLTPRWRATKQKDIVLGISTKKLSADPKILYIRTKKNSHRNRRGRSSSSSSSSSSRAWYLLHVGMFTEFHLGSFRASCRVSLGFHVGFHSGFHLGVHLGLHLGFHLEGFIEGYI